MIDMNCNNTRAKSHFVTPFLILFRRASNSRFARRVASVFWVKILGVGVGFVTQVVIARLLGEEQYGIHAYVISWLAILVMPSVFGMDMVTLRFFPAYVSSNSHGKAMGLLCFAKRFILIASLLTLVAGLGIVGVLYLTGQMEGSVALSYAAGFAAIPFLARMQLYTKVLWAFGKTTFESIVSGVAWSGLIVLFVLLASILLPFPLTATVSLAAYTLAILLVVVIGANNIKSHSRSVNQSPEGPEFEIALWIKTAIPLLMTSSFQIVLYQSSIVMVGYYLSYSEVGYYSVAHRMVQFVLFGLASTNVVVAPMMSSAYASHRIEDLKHALRNGATMVFGLTVPIVAFLLIAGPFFLDIFGQGFSRSYPSLAILCLGQTIQAFFGCIGYLMLMTRNERPTAVIFPSVAILNIILNALLIPVWGIEGAAFATTISIVVLNTWMLVIARKRLGVNPTILAWFTKSTPRT